VHGKARRRRRRKRRRRRRKGRGGVTKAANKRIKRVERE
jgi:hypothetical protein